jgi:CBS domain-containing protein
MMINKGIGCLPVVDAQQLVGIVTKTDLLRCLRALDAA